MSNKKLTIVNLVIVAYFALIYVLNFYHINLMPIGVFRELLTIPFLIAQIVFLGIGIWFLVNNKREKSLLISLFLLAVCTVLTFGSFF